jgi:putative ABC transport system permease protein
MQIRPIISALMRSKVALILIGLQIALTLAIVCNSLFIISQRIEKAGRPSGMNEADTFMVSSSGFGNNFHVKNAITEDLALLRSLPGVAAATATNSVPMSNSGWSEALFLNTEQKILTTAGAYYFMDDRGIDAFGLKLVAGRNFKPEEITVRDRDSDGWTSSLIVSKALAEKLFPGQDAIGKQVYLDQKKAPRTLIGVVERMQVPWPGGFVINGDQNSAEYSILVPQFLAGGNDSKYLIRAEHGRRDELMKTAESKLVESNHNRIVRSMKSMEKVRSDCYRRDRAMMIILGIVIMSLLTITALGIVGMASFWVTQRTKQIGTRRALGATKFDILRYFLTENFLITSGGLILGAVLAYGFSFWLMTHYQAKLLPWHYVPIGFLCLWALGQLAVLGPATRATKVSPAVATRSV